MIDDILARLSGVKRAGSQWKARCPAHEDRTPSLSITEKNGRILLHCFAGCDIESILNAMGTAKGELFENSPSEWEKVAEYDYTDRDGILRYQVVRFQPKKFLQRRPNGSGGWIWDLEGVSRVLYHLPEIGRANSIYVVEGEKDVEAIRKLGLVGTCNSGGAGRWKAEFSQVLHGKSVYIVADSDEPGRIHADDIAETLAGKVKSLKVIALPDAHDISEWVQRGGTREKLLKIFQDAQEWHPKALALPETATKPNRFQLTPLRDLLQEPPERISFLLDQRLPAGGPSILCAKPKVGKSTFARCLSISVAKGEPFLGSATTRGPVIYLALEEKRDEVRRHFEDLGASGNEEIHIHAAAAPQDALPELEVLTRKICPVLIVIDPLFKFLRIRDENAYAEVSAAMEPLLTLARQTGAHILVTHHSGKMLRGDATDSILGSTAFYGAVDTAIILKKSERFRTVQTSQRYGRDLPETLINFDVTTRSLSLGVPRSNFEIVRISEEIAEHLASREPQTRVSIEAAVVGRTTSKRAALKKLCATGRLSESGAGTKGDPLVYGLKADKDLPRDKASSEPCASVCAGTPEQQSPNGIEASENERDMVVPSLACSSEEQEFLEGKL